MSSCLDVPVEGPSTSRAPEPGAPNSDRRRELLELRKKVSPPAMLLDDGSINQHFFKPDKILFLIDKRWGDAESRLLQQGIAEHGVGSWGKICEGYLPAWDQHTLRVRATKLLGSQSLSRYTGWKGSEDAIAKEHARNKAVAERLGCWKHGCMVDNAAGDCKRFFEQQALAAHSAD